MSQTRGLRSEDGPALRREILQQAGLGTARLLPDGSLAAIDQTALHLLDLDTRFDDVAKVLGRRLDGLLHLRPGPLKSLGPDLVRCVARPGSSFSVEGELLKQSGQSAWLRFDLSRPAAGQPGSECIDVLISDATRYTAERDHLRERLRLHRSLNALMTHFVRMQPGTHDQKIPEFLDALGNWLGVDRAYTIFISSDSRTVREGYEWCRQGIPSALEILKKRSFERIVWVRQYLRAAGVVHVADTAAIPDEAEADAELLSAMSVRTFLGFLLVFRDTSMAVLMLDTVIEKKEWDPSLIDALKGLAQVVSATMLPLEPLVEDNSRPERHLYFVESSRDAIYQSSVDGKFVDVNPACLALFGYERDEMMGMPTVDVFVDPDVRQAFLREISKWGSVRDFEATLKKKGGGSINALLTASIRYEPGGSIAGTQGIVRDITAQKQVEEALRYRAEFERLMVSISTSFIGLGPEDTDAAIGQAIEDLGRFANVDRSYISVFAVEQAGGPARSGEVQQIQLRKDVEWCAPGIDPQEGVLKHASSEMYPWAWSLLTNGEPFAIDSLDELPPEASAERKLLESQDIKSAVCLPLTSGSEVIGILGFDSVRCERTWSEELVPLLRVASQAFSSAIERQLAEEERQRLEQQVRHAQKLESLGVLAGGIAHDFNNLLVGILGNTSLVLMDMPEDGPARKSLEHVQETAIRAAELTNQLLAYSGKGQFVVESVNLSRMTMEMHHLLQTAVSKKARFELELDGNLPAIKADVTQLRQVIMNLITNASDAIGEGTGVIAIRTGVMEADGDYLTSAIIGADAEAGHYVFLEVADDGIGMDSDTMSRMFDPFFSTKFAGRGLGLAAVMGIVTNLEGAIVVDSGVGDGTTFRVLLPPAGHLQPQQITFNMEEDNEDESGTVLVVDDEQFVLEVTSTLLSRFGFQVMTAYDGVNAVEVFEEKHQEIDVVLLDMTMPRMDGFEAYQAMRGIDPALSVILTSGYTAEDTFSRFEGENVGDFIQKPYAPDSLIRKIRTILAQRKRKPVQ